VLQELANYLDDDCAQAVRREIEEHLRRCHPCQVVVDTTRKTIRIVACSETFELPASLSEKIMAKISHHRDTENTEKS
jgi:predicted anti-sigma-YlaC factor YlaD